MKVAMRKAAKDAGLVTILASSAGMPDKVISTMLGLKKLRAGHSRSERRGGNVILEVG
jgi:hypothetical protein